MCKRCQNIFIGIKETCLGFLDWVDREKYNKRGLKEGKGREISTTVLPYTRCTLSSLKYSQTKVRPRIRSNRRPPTLLTKIHTCFELYKEGCSNVINTDVFFTVGNNKYCGLRPALLCSLVGAPVSKIKKRRRSNVVCKVVIERKVQSS